MDKNSVICIDKWIELIDKWAYLNERKTAYAFAGKQFEEERFVQTLRETFQIVQQFRINHFASKDYPKCTTDNLKPYSYLLVTLAIYSAELCGVDESAHYIFSASQAITRLLILYTTEFNKVVSADETGILCGSCKDCLGLCYVGDDNYWSQTFKYDTNTGDMSQIIELVNRANS